MRPPQLRRALAAFAALVVSACSHPQPATGWLENYGEALALAKKEGKLVLVCFEGSDWCMPCIEMKKKIFDSAAFRKYADAHLVLLAVDFPQGRPLPDAQAEENQALAKKYGALDGFDTLLVPTVALVDADGRLIKKQTGVFFTTDEAISWLANAGRKGS